jgi:hypothetical protein
MSALARVVEQASDCTLGDVVEVEGRGMLRCVYVEVTRGRKSERRVYFRQRANEKDIGPLFVLPDYTPVNRLK